MLAPHPHVEAQPRLFPSMTRMNAVFAFGVAVGLLATAHAATNFGDPQTAAFTDKYCAGCHNDTDKEAGLDLTGQKFAPTDPANFLTWVKVHDRLQAGEMPPKQKKRPDQS